MTLDEIRKNKPEGATHYDDYGNYWKIDYSRQWMYYESNQWFITNHTPSVKPLY